MIKFENTYSKLPERFYEKVNPDSFQSPELLFFNESLATELGIDFSGKSSQDLAKIFSGQTILPGSEPLAQAYSGHQFGHFSPQLGDGRAHLLGEVKGFDIQLKGSGQTRFSRRGDGRSALGPVIREYLVSEAMNALGVPTTRALAAVGTGEMVHRQYGPEPGGVFTRVAASHLRVGTFQYFASREDREAIEILLDYAIERHYPELKSLSSTGEKAIEFLKAVGERQAKLVAQWTGLGFIHGVMNTDNFSVAGITIDFGPCAFLDEYKKHKVFSSIDRQGRYSFFNQVPIAQWNLLRLADCLLPLIDEKIDKAAEKVEKEIVQVMELMPLKRTEALYKKLGISFEKEMGDDLPMSFLDYLEKESLDFTLAFRNLPELFAGESSFFPETSELELFISKWKDRKPDVASLTAVNPLFIPRNHLIQRAIDSSYEGRHDLFKQLNEVFSKPFENNEEMEHFSKPPKPDERVYQTFCGT